MYASKYFVIYFLDACVLARHGVRGAVVFAVSGTPSPTGSDTQDAFAQKGTCTLYR
jgi:hypothetical protein